MQHDGAIRGRDRILFATKTQSGSRLCQTNQTIRRLDCIAETGA